MPVYKESGEIAQTQKYENGLILTCREHAENPPANDPINGYAYGAMEDMLVQFPEVGDFFRECQSVREVNGDYLSDLHAIELACVHAVNFLMAFRENKPDYIKEMELFSREAWRNLFLNLLTHHLAEYKYLLLNKDIQKTEPTRGLSYSYVIQKMFGNQDVSVVDLGCSANWIWKHIAAGEVYEDINDQTDVGNNQGVLLAAANQGVNLRKCVGIDKSDPLADDEEWFLSCRNLSRMNSEELAITKQRIEDYRNQQKVFFQKGDILNLDLEEGIQDVVTISTALYQLTPEQRFEAIQKAKKLLKPNGVVIIQDYCHVDDEGALIFDETKEAFTYRTIVTGGVWGDQYLEIAQYEDSSCRVVQNGRHIVQFDSLIRVRAV